MGSGPEPRDGSASNGAYVELGGAPPAPREHSHARRSPPPVPASDAQQQQQQQQQQGEGEVAYPPIAPMGVAPWAVDGPQPQGGTPTSETEHGHAHGAAAACDDGNGGPAECRVCLLPDGEPGAGELVAPCHCAGTMRYAHLNCLVRWATEKGSLRCELCGAPYTPEVYGVLAAVLEEAGVEHDHGQPRPRGHRAHPLPTWPGTRPEEVAEDTPGQRRAKFWRMVMFNLAVLVVLVGAVLYLTLFSNFSSGSNWMVILWRVLVVLVPAWLIGRVAMILFIKWRDDRRARRAREAAEQAAGGTRQDMQNAPNGVMGVAAV